MNSATPATSTSPHPRWYHLGRAEWTGIGVLVGVVGLIVAIIAWQFPSAPTQEAGPTHSSATPQNATSATPIVSTVPTATLSTPSGDPASSPNSEAPGGATGMVFLADLPVVGARFDPRLGTTYTSQDDAGFVGFRTGVIEAGGDTLAHAVYHRQFQQGDQAYLEYDLSRDYAELSFQAVVSDASATSAKVRFEIYLDNKIVKSVVTTFGSPTPVSVPTTGALRLRILLVRVDGTSGSILAGMAEATIQRA